ncbi:MAG: FAD-binding protein [Clostridia bacterium]|nr:FAD-binding protein [Clostridia bacterium]
MRIIEYKAVVVGTGAAGYAVACRLAEAGVNVAIVTENKNSGTSRNAGSDKQTYYKLSLAGDSPDSVGEMAADLFSGGAVDGDIALCEAALSVPCFLNLCSVGVPFPVNEFGEYPGYITDHDTHGRATSAGPLTSKMMTEALEKRAEILNIPVLDKHSALKVLKTDGHVSGLICFDSYAGESCLIRCENVILATGGPAGIYKDSVYPESQHGSSSLALDAGASLRNMTEWQYGLASVSPRWNVSGTYMQALPRFVSVDEDGTEREFLTEWYKNPADAVSSVFMKGYQWPFDSGKIEGSSKIDLIVYRETVLLGRRVYLDFTKNPSGLEKGFEGLSCEAFDYLKRNEACFGKPIDRLEHMNAPAVDFYRSKGVELRTEMLEIRLCAQHNNGGIEVDSNWQTSVPGLFAVGECAGTHGIRRPGGSALNAGQVGAARAAAYISEGLGAAAASGCLPPEAPESADIRTFGKLVSYAKTSEAELWRSRLDKLKSDMSDVAGPIRSTAGMKRLYEAVLTELEGMGDDKQKDHSGENKSKCGIDENAFPFAAVTAEPAIEDRKTADAERTVSFFEYYDALKTSAAVLASMIDFAERIGVSRGSCLYVGDGADGIIPGFGSVAVDGNAERDMIQSVYIKNEGAVSAEPAVAWRKVRPLPDRREPFEAVWRKFREKNRKTD